MADYWKSIDKKFCDVCKCWLTDNKASVAFHENGNRHKQNVQQRLKDIHKKNKADDKKDKKLEQQMRKIEEAALAASKKDIEDNPDVSMKINTYFERLKKESGGGDEDKADDKKLGQAKIVHRSEKQIKTDEAMLAEINRPHQAYAKFSGWETKKEKKGGNYLELPTTTGTKSPGNALKLAAKIDDHEPITFGEKTVSISTSTSSTSFIKTDISEVAFKKRKLSKGTMRRRVDDEV